MQSASAAFLAESQKTTEGARPGVAIKIETATGLVSYGNRVTSVSDVDRVLEKYGEQGIGFAGDVTFTLENTDGIFSPGSRDTGPFQGQLIGRQVAIYQFYFTKEPDVLPYMTTAKGMTTTVDMDTGVTERLPIFTGKISRAIVNDNRTVTITVRDAIQDLVEAIMASTGQALGNVADVLKYILEAAGFDVNTAAHERLRLETQGSYVARTWSTGDKAIDLVQDINKACGTNVVANAEGEMVMLQLAPLWGEFARFFYQDKTQEPEYSGEESDGSVDLNVLNSAGSNDEVFIVNTVNFTFVDLATGQPVTYAYLDTASILKYGIKSLDISTGASLPRANAYIWPSRILDRYAGEDATLYDDRTSLRHSSVAEVGDHAYLTEPSGDEVETLVMITQASRNPFVTTAGMQFEAVREFVDEKWAFAGDDSPGGSERDSGQFDFLYNKSFEHAVNPGTDDTPLKWALASGTGGTFAVSSAEQRTGQKSLHVVSAANNAKYRQDIDGVSLLFGQPYIVSIYYKGTVTTGSCKVNILDSVGTVKATITISATASDWTRVTATFTPFGNFPWDVEVDMNGGTFDIYLDDIQIDNGSTAKDFQENWLHYAYAGEAADQSSPGFDLEGNNNGVINRDYMTGWEQLYKAF